MPSSCSQRKRRKPSADDLILSSPIVLKNPHTYEYARQMIVRLKRKWECLRLEEKEWRHDLEDAKQNEIWEPLDYPTLDALLKAEIGVTEQQSIEQIKTRDLKDAKERGRMGGLTAGRGRPKDEQASDIVTSLLPTKPAKSARGNTREYWASRLKRDHPDIFKRLEAGEFKSVRAAAIEAGIVKDPTGKQLLNRAWKKAIEVERREFIAEHAAEYGYTALHARKGI
jgi:hypothetical protein